jgi:hypothetical protein
MDLGYYDHCQGGESRDISDTLTTFEAKMDLTEANKTPKFSHGEQSQ